ncbi:MAG: hypothetical protein ACYC7D_06135 [Nitrososphaerales archaeon]
MRRSLEIDMRSLYRFAKTIFASAGVAIIAYGIWFLGSPLLFSQDNPDSWFGIFPLYLGAMMILLSLAMKEDWFTNARKYW